MGGRDSEEREVNKEEPNLSPRAHGGNEQELVSEARARVDQLWRTIQATGMRELWSQRGGKLTLDNSDGPVNYVERQSDPSASSQDLRRPMESIAKTEGHPVADVHERLQLPHLDRSTQSLISGSTASTASFFDSPCIPSKDDEGEGDDDYEVEGDDDDEDEEERIAFFVIVLVGAIASFICRVIVKFYF